MRLDGAGEISAGLCRPGTPGQGCRLLVAWDCRKLRGEGAMLSCSVTDNPAIALYGAA